MEEIVARPGFPLAYPGIRISGWYFPVGFKAAEVVDTNEVAPFQDASEAADPPIVSRMLVDVPSVERVTPALAALGEVIGRNAGDDGGVSMLIELEKVLSGPNIGGIHRNENGDIPDDADALFGCILPEFAPLLFEDELNEGLEIASCSQLFLPVLE